MTKTQSWELGRFNGMLVRQFVEENIGEEERRNYIGVVRERIEQSNLYSGRGENGYIKNPDYLDPQVMAALIIASLNSACKGDSFARFKESFLEILKD